jgi:hypothetical protein
VLNTLTQQQQQQQQSAAALPALVLLKLFGHQALLKCSTC